MSEKRQATMFELPQEGPFQRPGVVARLAPFGLALGLGFLLYPFGSPDEWWPLAVAAALVATVGAAIAWLPWRDLPPDAQLVPALVTIGAVALLRHGLGTFSGYGPLLLVPVVWVALYMRIKEVVAGIATVVAVLATPILFIGGERYPSEQWRLVVFYAVVGGLLGIAINSLVRALRLEMSRRNAMEQQLRSRTALELNDRVVQDLAIAQMSLELKDSDRARAAVARALAVMKRHVSSMLASDGAEIEPGDLARRDTEKT